MSSSGPYMHQHMQEHAPTCSCVHTYSRCCSDYLDMSEILFACKTYSLASVGLRSSCTGLSFVSFSQLLWTSHIPFPCYLSTYVPAIMFSTFLMISICDLQIQHHRDHVTRSGMPSPCFLPNKLWTLITLADPSQQHLN